MRLSGRPPERNNWLRLSVLSLRGDNQTQSRPAHDSVNAGASTVRPLAPAPRFLQPAAATRGKASIMPDTKTPTTELTSQYTAQVANDLERNAKEQERITAEIDALQEQLRALQHDHTVLTNMQKALGTADTAAQPATEETATPSVPRQKTDAEPGSGKRARAKRTPAVQDGEAARKPASKKPTAVPKATAAKPTQPTLVDLIRRHLTDQSEPAPRPKSPPHSARPTPTAPSKPPSYAPRSKDSSPRAMPSAPSKAPPSTTPPPTPRNRPHP